MSTQEPVTRKAGEELELIRQAVKTRQSLSFRYRNSNGEITNHNAVYPRRIFTSGGQRLFEAYCHFTKDVRVFRFDRVQRIQLGRSERQRLVYLIGGGLLVMAVLVFVFAVLVLFSPKYQWRQVREFLFGS